MFNVWELKPFDALAVFPETILCAVCFLVIYVYSEAVLSAFLPITLVPAVVWPVVDAVPVFLVVQEFPMECSAILPFVHADAFHVVVKPFALIASAVEPGVHTNAKDLVLVPLPRILRAISPLVGSEAMFTSMIVFALIKGTISPAFSAQAMLQVVLPETLINTSTCMLVYAKPIGFVVYPQTLVGISINVDELAVAVGLVIAPLPEVLGAICPGLLAVPISEAAFPFTLVERTAFEPMWRKLHAGLIHIVLRAAVYSALSLLFLACLAILILPATSVSCFRANFSEFSLRKIFGRPIILILHHRHHPPGPPTSKPSLYPQNQMQIILEHQLTFLIRNSMY